MTGNLVSIIVPVYNASKYLEETILSVISQTHSNWNLLLIDDGSTDNSAEICQRYVQQDERIQYYYKSNGGQGSARNLGIEKSNSNLLAFLDSDDLWKIDKLEKQLKVLEQHPEVDLQFTQGIIFNETGVLRSFSKWKTGLLQGKSWMKELYLRSGIINSSVMLKAELFTEKVRFDEDDAQRGTEDYDVWLKLALDNKVFYGLDEELVEYREHAEGVHLQTVRMLKGAERVYLKHQNNSKISKSVRKQRYRIVYRELMNVLKEEGNLSEIKATFKRLTAVVPWSFGTLFQKMILPISSDRFFYWISRKVIFRIAYTIENIGR